MDLSKLSGSIWLDGELVPWEEAKVHVLTHTFHYGLGVFEDNLELEGQGRGIIMGVTRLLLLGQFYTIQSKFMYYFAHDCKASSINLLVPYKSLANFDHKNE